MVFSPGLTPPRRHAGGRRGAGLHGSEGRSGRASEARGRVVRDVRDRQRARPHVGDSVAGGRGASARDVSEVEQVR